MSKLALLGGKPEVDGPIARFNTIGERELQNVLECMSGGALSGFLAGKEFGGYWVRKLEDELAQAINVKHAIASNSATSSLLAAAFAIDLNPECKFLCPALTMSATCAAPMFTGATPVFCDVDEDTFNMNASEVIGNNTSLPPVDAVFLTHLFGLSCGETWWTGWAHDHRIKIVVDAAQAPFAMCGNAYAGTEADIGILSWNVHKPLESGEGGMCLTNNDELAHRIRMFVNHGECSGERRIGLNLRMCEVTAAIAQAQLERADEIIEGRIALADALSSAVDNLPGLRAPYVPPQCRHVYYCWPLKVSGDRDWFVRAMNAEGVPLQTGYRDPLYRLPAFQQFSRPCPVAERLHDKELALFEICAWDPSREQIFQITNAFHKVSNHANR